MKGLVSIAMLSMLSGCILHIPDMQCTLLIDEPRGPARGDVICARCTVAVTQACIREAAEKIGFTPDVSDTAFRAVNYRHITPRELHGVLKKIEWGILVSASVDAALPATKSELMVYFIASMNVCNARLAPTSLM